VWLRLWQQQRMRQLDLDSPASVLLWRQQRIWRLRYVKWLRMRMWLRQWMRQQRRMRQLDLDSPASVLLWRQQRRRMRMLLSSILAQV
jgi:hypothetical protein